MATLIETNGRRTERQPANASEGFTLDELRTLIGCEWVETARMPDGSFFVLDEEGKLLDKPLNVEATKIYRRYYDDYIVGAALLCKPGEVL